MTGVPLEIRLPDAIEVTPCHLLAVVVDRQVGFVRDRYDWSVMR